MLQLRIAPGGFRNHDGYERRVPGDSRHPRASLRRLSRARRAVPSLDRLDAVLERAVQAALADRPEHEPEELSLEVLAITYDDIVDRGRPVGVARVGVGVA